ncbi:MAG: clostripain-related cysteine peptidase [Verrucomicrobiota bacterium]|nr:clostripain-related cysteine peptidase [Verrucomicrobiota bacterium]
MTKKAWTVMVYLAGDNNLDSAGVTDLGEMKKVGSTDQINVVAQFDREAKGAQTRRYFLKKGGLLDSDVVGNLGETDTGDPKVLIDFVKWSVKNYPAARYMLVVWNHGNGWDDTDVYRLARGVGAKITRRGQTIAPANTEGDGGDVSMRRIRVIATRKHRALFRTSIEAAVRARGIAYDDNAQDFLDNRELQRVLVAAKKTIGRNLDVLGLDACLMSMAEVGYENRVATDFTVGSEQTEPGDGWPYNTILGDLAKKPAMTGRDLASNIVKRYLASYPADGGVTQAACDLAQSPALLKAISSLGDIMRAALADANARAGMIQSRAQVQSYETADYVDLQDLCQLLKSNCAQSPSIVKAAQAVLDACAKYVIASGAKGNAVANSHGVSIHFPNNPQAPLSPLYANLDFAQDGTWDEFLKAWLGNLQRR